MCRWLAVGVRDLRRVRLDVVVLQRVPVTLGRLGRGSRDPSRLEDHTLTRHRREPLGRSRESLYHRRDSLPPKDEDVCDEAPVGEPL